MTEAPESRRALEAAAAGPWRETPFVGREREVAALHRLLEGGGHARHAFVEGEAGIGKTRLVSEFLSELDEGEVRVLRGFCYQVEEAEAYAPFLQILSQVRTEAGASELLLELANEVAGAHAELTLDQDVPGRRGRLVDALARTVLREIGEGRNVMCVEDLEWADEGSLLLLNRLLDSAPANLVVICTWRTGEPAEAAVRQLVARIEQRSTRILLGGLNSEGVRWFVDQWAGAPDLTGDEVDVVARFTNGNPMFLREVLLHLQESGLLERHTLREAIELAGIPEHLVSLVDRRLEQLSPEVLRALEAGAVIGNEFPLDLAAQTAGSGLAETEELLELGTSRRILERLRGREMPHYKFSHLVFAKRLYDMTPASLRREFHARVARAAERGRALLTVEERARHHALGLGPAGGQTGVDYCREAAELAEHVLAFDTAGRFWELALRCTPPEAARMRADLLRRLGWALWAAGKWERAGEAWRMAVAQFESIEERGPVAGLALALGEMHRWRQEHEEAERWLERALELPGEDSRGRARALALLGSLHCQRGSQQGLPLLEEACALVADEHVDPIVTYWLSYGFLVSGDRVRSYATARSGLREARRTSDRRATALLAASLFHQDLAQLRPGRARSYARAMRRVTDRSDPTAMIRLLLCEALLLMYGGEWKTVLETCESWLSMVRLAGRFQVATASAVWAEARLALGDAAQAVSVMRRVLPDLEPTKQVAALHMARALARAGETDEAGALLREHTQRLKMSRRFTDAAGRALMGEVASLLEEPNLWKASYELLLREECPLVMTYAPISVRRVLGRLAGRLGLWPEAFEHFESATEELQRGTAHGELVRAYLDHAEVRSRRGRRGDQSKAKALQLQAGSLARKQGIFDPSSADVPDAGGNRFNLTERELEVLRHVAAGLRNQEIAAAMSISPGTVNRHLENVFIKMDVRARAEAVMVAFQEGLIGPLASEV
ncbi:MAG: AAA family ATPase [Dehalococcoidia bacterium]|nr:AAA family ATPase [Dehalococcoidia bacterium]